jgi:hypothetical protein
MKVPERLRVRAIGHHPRRGTQMEVTHDEQHTGNQQRVARNLERRLGARERADVERDDEQARGRLASVPPPDPALEVARVGEQRLR